MGLWMIQSVKRELEDKYSFAELAAMAQCKPFIGTVDVNDGRFLAPASMIGEVNRSFGGKLGIASVMRVIYDSLAQSYAEAIRALEENTGGEYDRLYIFGGGCRDELLNRLTAQATGKRVVTGPVEATAVGNLLMQMIGAGELGDLAAARALVRKSFEIKEIS